MENSSDTKPKKIRGFLKRHKKLLIFLCVLIVAAVAVLVVLGQMNAANSAVVLPQTTTLAKMNLEQVVTATGTVQSSDVRDVTSNLSLNVQEVFVDVGDTVEAGKLLCVLDTTDLDKTIATTQKSINDAVVQDRLSLEQNTRRLEDARNQRDLDSTRLDGEVSRTANALSDAHTAQQNAQTDLSAAHQVLAQVREAYTTAQQVYSESAKEAADLALLQQATLNYETNKPLAEAEIAAQQKACDAAAAAATAAQSALDMAVQSRDTTYRNNSIAIENAQDSVNSLKLKDSADAFRTQLKDYLQDKEDAQITAPVGGTITAMTAEVGKSAGGSAAGLTGTSTASSSLFTIENTKKLEIPASVPEYDAVNLTVGLGVTITSDALDGQTWKGTVTSISPKATDDAANFTVHVEISSSVGQLAIGMSSKLNIITAAKADVFAVPYDAVTLNAAGESVVMQWMGGTPGQAGGPNAVSGVNSTSEGPAQAQNTGKPTRPTDASGAPDMASMMKEVVVQTGMETDYYIEITGDGLSEGMTILTDPESKNVSTATDTNGFGMVGRPMGGG